MNDLTKAINIANIFPIFFKQKNYIGFLSMFIYNKKNIAKNINQFFVKIDNNKYIPKYLFKKGIPFLKGYYINFYKVKIDIQSLMNLDIQNKLFFTVDDEDVSIGIGYNLINFKKGKYKNGPIYIHKKTNTSFYFRQSVKNAIYVTVRKTNQTDSKKEQRKIFLAYLLSKICFFINPILLFEKESSKYEESASVLYEKLIDKKYKNVYYILEKNYQFIDNIKDKYKTNLIYKGSFKHYLYFFCCKKFIGTETLAHSIDLRIANKYATRKLNKKNINYVFLQHGVMYMISLSSNLRTGFYKKEGYNTKTVVSSVLEANHFIDLGGYEMDDLYICGLPKYDRNIRYENADKIVIMPTWRRWEYNMARIDFSKTKYYEMIMNIISAIPKKFHDKIIVLPHPLFNEAVKNSKTELNQYFKNNFKYDDILKETDLLITDYSSIAYDAFYRGCKVIFYWEQKDETIKMYGENTKLMINKNNIFGDICYNKKELKEAFNDNYMGKQKTKYKNRYNKIVSFHDNKNTERLIRMLKKDKFI